ncbi:MAG: hypothetical protein IKP86_06240 [Anaerolineaceae bacterium]|nr:hypothetical protein [Anaerolineaceae bacterium]
MAKGAVFTYAPSRGKGLLFLVPVCGGLTALEIFLLQHFDSTEIGTLFILLLIAVLLIAVPLVFLLYRLFSLIFSSYRLERDGLHIHWGLRAEVIPLNAIEWIRHPQEMIVDVPWSVLPMPGAYLGTVPIDEQLTFEFLASDMNTMLFLGTSRYIYVISPRDPSAFLSGFERILQMGALTNINWTTARPAGWILEAWQNRIGRISTIISLILIISLFVLTGIHFESGKTVQMLFSPEGKQLDSIYARISTVNMLAIPVCAAFIWLTGTIVGLRLYQNRKYRRIAELIWVGVSAAVFQCLAAGIAVF